MQLDITVIVGHWEGSDRKEIWVYEYEICDYRYPKPIGYDSGESK